MKRKRSLSELDDVIDEIIDRNPEWVLQLEKIIEESNERNLGRKVSSKDS